MADAGGLACFGINHHNVGSVQRSGIFNPLALFILTLGPHMLKTDVQTLHHDFIMLRKHLGDFAGFTLILAGDNFYVVIFLDLHKSNI